MNHEFCFFIDCQAFAALIAAYLDGTPFTLINPDDVPALAQGL